MVRYGVKLKKIINVNKTCSVVIIIVIVTQVSET
jgi:hypothetical protein